MGKKKNKEGNEQVTLIVFSENYQEHYYQFIGVSMMLIIEVYNPISHIFDFIRQDKYFPIYIQSIYILYNIIYIIF